MEKGLLTKEKEKSLIDFICSKIVFKNKWVERFKRPVVSAAIHYGDNSGLDHIPEQWKKDLMPIIDLIIAKDYEGARLYVNDFANKLIDLKKVSELNELELIDSSTRLIKSIIIMLQENSKV